MSSQNTAVRKMEGFEASAKAFERNRARMNDEFRGQWVVFYQGELAGASFSLLGLARILERKGISEEGDIFVHFVVP